MTTCTTPQTDLETKLPQVTASVASYVLAVRAEPQVVTSVQLPTFAGFFASAEGFTGPPGVINGTSNKPTVEVR